ncbi:hypothetical protein ACFVFS_04165 [Kitasatospora sp. NPDC057692]|uniref:hypothetical protein n=1 Tax=Kitasatospora sp. NPDC057692 TaxID=3346215 RepID=UPI0036C5B04A
MHVRDLVLATLVAEAMAALFVGVAVLAGWLLLGDDWIRGLPWAIWVLGADWAPVEYYRRRPPHRVRGAAAGLLVLGLVAAAVVVGVESLLPDAAPDDLDGALALAAALPVAAGAFAAVAGPLPEDGPEPQADPQADPQTGPRTEPGTESAPDPGRAED